MQLKLLHEPGSFKKRPRFEQHESPLWGAVASESLCKTFVIKEEPIANKRKNSNTCDVYNPTPLSTKMQIKNMLKDSGNSKANVPVMLKKKLMDVKKPQDDSTNSFIKLPMIIPLVTTRKFIAFDDLDTDDEKPKGRYPKWSFSRYYKRRSREQVLVNEHLLSVLFSCPNLNPFSVFPTANVNQLERNESSIWEN